MTRAIVDSDAFGHVVYDRYRGQAVQYVIERDDGYIDVDDLHTYFADYPSWPPRLKQAIRLATGKVLDVCCGAGRAALYLQRKGCDVLGIDTSPLALKVCRLRGVRHTRLMSIADADSQLGTFDTILMLGNNFGVMGSPTRTRALLRRFYKMTSPHARILAETLDPTRTKAAHHLEYQRANRRRGRLPGQLRLRFRYQAYASPWFGYLFVSRPEFRHLVAGTGWTIRRFFQSAGPSYIAVLEKAR